MSEVIIDHEKFGVPDYIAKNIRDQFQPMLDTMVALEDQFNKVIQLDPEDESTSKAASELRKKYVKIRTGVDKIHKEQKAFYLAGGRFVDGWKNAHLMASQDKEERLRQIENFVENREKKRIADLHEKRCAEIMPYLQEPETHMNYGMLSDSVWDAYLKGKIKIHMEFQEAVRQAEENEAKEKRKREILSSRMPMVFRYGRYIAPSNQSEDVIAVMDDRSFEAMIANAKELEKDELEENERIRQRARQLEEEAKKREESAVVATPQVVSATEQDNDEEMSTADKLAKWVLSMDLPVCPDYGNEVSIEIINKFVGFKSWANRLIDQKLR